MAIVFGNVPQFGYVDRFITEKREGFGWNDLGPRNIKGVTFHRMVGALRGTDSYFRMPNISSYTDYGIATKTSDPGMEGTICLWNYPWGRRAPWASGPVSAPYGDGLAMVQKYGINAVNRDVISLEIGGTNEVIDDFTWSEIIWFTAYWADQCKIPWTTFPHNPCTGFSFLFFHEEFTYGTGKRCPFQYFKDNINRVVTDVKEVLRKYQEGIVAAPLPTPAPAPAPVEPKQWKDPAPVRELAMSDPDTAGDFKISNGTNFRPVFDEVEAIKQGKQRRFAIDGDTVDVIGPDYQPGDRFTAMYRFTNNTGTEYLYLSNHARVLFADFKRIAD